MIINCDFSNVVDITPRRLKVLRSSFVSISLAIRADSLICAGGQSTQTLFSRVKLRGVYGITVDVLLAVGLSNLTFLVRLLTEDVWVMKGLASEGNWLWQLCHIFWEGYRWVYRCQVW